MDAFLSFALTTLRAGAWDFDAETGATRRFILQDQIFGDAPQLPRTYQQYLDHVLPEDRERVDRIYRHAVETESDFSLECRISRTDGEVRWIWAAGKSFHDPVDGRQRMSGIVQDITDRKRAEQSSIADITARRQAEEALRASEQIARQRLLELEAVYETAPIGLCVFDENLRWTRLNRVIAEINGTPIEEHLGRTPSEIIPDVGPQAEEALRAILQTGERLDFEMHGTTAAQPGVERVWSEHWVPIKDPDGRIQGISVAAEEITDRKRAAEALAASEERLRQADRHKDEFLGWLSHELRNPVNVIRGNLALIEKAGLESPHARRALSGLNRQVGIVSSLLEDLLDVTRISKGKIRLQRTAVELNDLVRTIGDDQRGEFERRGIHFEVRLPQTALHAAADRTRMTQVIGNLLHNACKFTPADGHVSLSLTRDAGPWAIIEVRDDGAGIRPELLDRLFDPLVQDDRTIARSEGGMGLGLSLVKGLVELHGGSVSVASDGPELGAVFTVRLPLSIAAASTGDSPALDEP